MDVIQSKSDVKKGIIRIVYVGLRILQDNTKTNANRKNKFRSVTVGSQPSFHFWLHPTCLLITSTSIQPFHWAPYQKTTRTITRTTTKYCLTLTNHLATN